MHSIVDWQPKHHIKKKLIYLNLIQDYCKEFKSQQIRRFLKAMHLICDLFEIPHKEPNNSQVILNNFENHKK